jgi:hypothetical protein
VACGPLDRVFYSETRSAAHRRCTLTRSRPRATALRAPALALALLLVACGGDGGTGPGPTKLANPLATAARIRGLDASFTSPAFQSFARIPSPAPITPISPLAPLRSVLRTAGRVLDGHAAMSSMERRLAAEALRAALVAASGTAAAVIIPPGLRGKTYEWNGSQYHVTQRQGAPANGVRFILYALDPGDAPIGTQEIGYADLIDESTGSTDRLHILVVGLNPPVTYADYRITVSATATSGTVTGVGFVTDGTHRLDFNAVTTETATGASVDIRFDVNADDLHVRLKLAITEPTQTTLKVTVDLSLDLGAEVVTVTGSETIDSGASTITGAYTVRVNGGIYATVAISSLPPSVGPPSYTGGPGLELTADDHTALNAIHEAISTLLIRLLDLVAPVFFIPVP